MKRETAINVLKVNREDILETMFNDKRSYENFMKAFDVLYKLQSIKDSGGMIIQQRHIFLKEEYFCVRLDCDDEGEDLLKLGSCWEHDKDSRTITTFLSSRKINKKQTHFINDFNYVHKTHIGKAEYL